MTSARTIIRDRIVEEFARHKQGGGGRVPEFAVSLRWLAETETQRANTYCIVVTDEARNSQTQQDDSYQLSGVVVLYAYDTKDARAKLDLMVEDAIDVLRRALKALQGIVQHAMVESITTTDATTAEGAWTQAVVRWNAVHRRRVIV